MIYLYEIIFKIGPAVSVFEKRGKLFDRPINKAEKKATR